MRRFLLCTSLFVVVMGCSKPTVDTLSTSVSGAPAPDGEVTVVEKAKSNSEPNEQTNLEAATAVDAETVFADALKLAAKDDKRVLVHLGAPW